MMTAAVQGGMDGPAVRAGLVADVPPGSGQPDAQQAELAALLGRIANGDQGALESFYDRTLPRVFAVARRFCADPALAEEVTEDVYFQVWREAGRFDPERAPALGWLLMLARSRALDALRRAEPVLVTEDPLALVAEDGDPAVDPLQLLGSLQRDSEVHRALATLPARDRQIVALSFLRGLTHAEIAATTRLPLGTIKTAVRRSLLALRGQLAAHAPEGFGGFIDEVDHEESH
jgi:RNA polymerase sigma-70 factor (ECF subfamily)